MSHPTLLQYAMGGQVPPYRAKNKADYDDRLRMYADSAITHRVDSRKALEMMREPQKWADTNDKFTGTQEEADAILRLMRRGIDTTKGEKFVHPNPSIVGRTLMSQIVFPGPRQKVLPPESLTDQSAPLQPKPKSILTKTVATYREPLPQRIDTRMPNSVTPGRPVGVDVPAVAQPDYQFHGGFVDPRVANDSTIRSEANRQVADPELTMKKKPSLLRYAYGGQLNDLSGGGGGSPYAAAAGALVSTIPPIGGSKDGVRGDNDLKYTKMGSSLMAVNPIAGAIGAGVGFVADKVIGAKNKKEAANDQKLVAQEQFAQMYGPQGAQNPYAGPDGYMQTMPTMAKGGSVPAGHVIPAENARKAIDHAAAAGHDIARPVQQGEAEGGLIPGSGGSKADDKVFQPAGSESIRVSSGEAYVNGELFHKMARAVGMGVAQYQREMYPNTQHGSGYADGGQIPPQQPPGNGDQYQRLREQYNSFLESGIPTDPSSRNGVAYEDVLKGLERYVGPRSSWQKTNKPVGSVFPGHIGESLPAWLGGSTMTESYNLPLKPTVSTAAAPRAQVPPTQMSDPNFKGFGQDGLGALLDGKPTASPTTPARAKTAAPSVATAPATPTAQAEAPRNMGNFQTEGAQDPHRFDYTSEPGTPPSLLGRDLRPTQSAPAGTAPAPVLGNSQPVSAPILPGKPTNAAKSNTGSAPNPGPGNNKSNGGGGLGGNPDLDKWNNISFGVNAAMSVGSLAYNLFSRRTPGIRPPSLALQRLDLKTDALAANLDSERTSARATALYESTNKQGIGRDLGVLSADNKARNSNASTVENVKNNERNANNQITNQERLYNNGQTIGYLNRETQANDQFRAMKGEAVNQSLAAISGSIGSYVNNKIQIGAMNQMDSFADRYLKYQSGADETATWDPSHLMFGDARRMRRFDFKLSNSVR